MLRHGSQGWPRIKARLDWLPCQRKYPISKQAAGFIETTDCLPVAQFPEGRQWTYEILCDGQHKISYVVKVIMWCWIIVAATFASEPGCMILNPGWPSMFSSGK
jgi:hypothetical protein